MHQVLFNLIVYKGNAAEINYLMQRSFDSELLECIILLLYCTVVHNDVFYKYQWRFDRVSDILLNSETCSNSIVYLCYLSAVSNYQ
jgi:hypothetical protein